MSKNSIDSELYKNGQYPGEIAAKFTANPNSKAKKKSDSPSGKKLTSFEEAIREAKQVKERAALKAARETVVSQVLQIEKIIGIAVQSTKDREEAKAESDKHSDINYEKNFDYYHLYRENIFQSLLLLLPSLHLNFDQFILIIYDIYSNFKPLSERFRKIAPRSLAFLLVLFMLHQGREKVVSSNQPPAPPAFPTPDFSGRAAANIKLQSHEAPIANLPVMDDGKTSSPELNWEGAETSDVILKLEPGRSVTKEIQIRYSIDWQADSTLRNAILSQLRRDNPTINIDQVKPEERVKISPKARSLIKELWKKKSKK